MTHVGYYSLNDKLLLLVLDLLYRFLVSGQQPANPLLLLGQYSDDDMEDGSSDGNQDTTNAESNEQVNLV